MRLNEIADNKGARSKRKTLGRGIGSGLGKTCGRGGKGQTARSGVSINGFEGGQTPIYRRLPKRGFVNIHAKCLYELSLKDLEKLITKNKIASDTVIDLALLKNMNLARTVHEGISVFGTTDKDFSHKVSLVVDRISKTSALLLEKTGSTVKVIECPEPVRKMVKRVS